MIKRRRDPLPPPRELEAECARVRREMTDMLEEYRWAYYAMLQPAVAESGGSRGDVAYSDPTGGTASAKEAARQQLRDAAKALTDAGNDISAHRRALERLMGLRGVPTIPRGGGPRTATRAELQEARDKQECRAQAGGGYGES